MGEGRGRDADDGSQRLAAAVDCDIIFDGERRSGYTHHGHPSAQMVNRNACEALLRGAGYTVSLEGG